MTNIQRFYDSFKRFLWLNQFFCVAPIKLNLTLNAKATRKFRDSFFNLLHLTYAFIVCSCVSYALFLKMNSNNVVMNFLTRTLYMGEYIIGVVNMLLPIIGCQYQRKFYKIFFERLATVDKNLQKCGIQADFVATRRYLKRSTYAFIIFFISVIIVDFFFCQMNVVKSSVNLTVYMIPNIVSTLSLIQYLMVLHFIREKFKTINSIVRNLTVDSLSDSRIEVISLQSIKVAHFGIARVLDISRRQHAELSRLVELLTKCFGVLIVINLTAGYVIISNQFYELYKISVGINPHSPILILYTVLWIILHTAKIFIILYPNNEVSDEKKLTGNLLFEINLAEKRIKDPSIAFMLKTFADQLLHENLTPNALRVVRLDLNFIGTFVGGLTTYLVILIQFDDSLNE